MTESYDIIVVGGGPAGLTAGRFASADGADVLLLELQAQIGGQTQTSAWVPSKLLEGDLKRSISSSVDKVNFHSTHENLEVGGDFGGIIDRKILDKTLAARAVEEGVDIWVGSPVEDLLFKNGGVYGIRTEAGDWSEDIECKMVIDATGSKARWSSLFLQKLLKKGWNEEKINQANEYLMANVSDRNMIDIYFNALLAPMGYAWIYPESNNFAMAGISGLRIHPDSALDEFLGREEPDRLADSVPIGEYRSRIPIGKPLDVTTSNGIMVVGGAAGQIYPLSGHGMRYALESGEIADCIAADSADIGDVSDGKLSEYDRLWRRRFGDEIRIGSLLRDFMKASPDKKMDSLLGFLSENPGIAEDFVNIFIPNDLKEVVPDFFEEKKCVQTFGEERVDRILSSIS